jgi:hypothetical protein
MMQDTASTSLELQNDKEFNLEGCATESAAPISMEKVDGDGVMQDTTSQLRNDKELPVWLSQMIAYLRGVSEDVAWQDLVTEFVDFERCGPPHGVRFPRPHHIKTT